MSETDESLPKAASDSRRGEVLTATFMWLLLGIFTVLAIGGPLVGRGVFLATEIMGDHAPWQSYLEDEAPAPNGYVGDTIDSMAPQTIRLVDDTLAGALPEWSPYGLGGFELGGLPNSGAYSPLSLPWWVLPHDYAPGIVKLLEIGAITLGMSLFLRRLGLPQATWPVGSLIYAASGFMVVWTNWPQTRVAALIPLLFWAVDRAAVRAKPVDAVPVGLVFAAMVLGGFPAITIYAGYAVGAWGLFRAVQAHRRSMRRLVGSLLVCGTGVAVGLLLSAWQLVPFAANASSVLNLEARNYAGVHLPFQYLASMFFPEIAGGIRIGLLTTIPVAGLSFVGMVALVLVAILPLARAMFPGQVGALVFFAVGIAWLIPAIYFGGTALALLQQLPTMDTSHIGRARVIIGFFVAVLASYGLGLLLRGRTAFVLRNTDAPLRWTTVLRVLASAGILAAAAVVSLRAWELVPANLTYLIVPEALTMIAIAAAAAVAVLVIMTTDVLTLRRLGVASLALALVLPAIGLARLWWAPSAEEAFYPVTTTHAFLQENLGDQRYEVVGSTLLPGTNQVYELRSFGGRGFVTAQWREVLQAVDPDYFITPTYARLSSRVAPLAGEQPIFDRFGVRYLVQSGLQRAYGAPPVELAAPSGTQTLAPGEIAESPSGLGPLRGVSFQIASDMPTTGLRSTVEIVDAQGRSLVESTSWQRTAQGEIHLAVPGEDLAPDQPWRVRLRADADSGPVSVETTGEGKLWISLVAPADDGLRVVSTGDATIYERPSALARVRWADRAVLEVDPERRLALLAGRSLPATAVVLERPEDVRTQEPGPPATVAPVDVDDLNTQAYQVSAQAAGWVVVEDSLRRPGWSAAIDGAAAEIVPADHAAGAVYVPAGTHRVELRYQTPRFEEGVLISAVTAVALLLILGARALVYRRR